MIFDDPKPYTEKEYHDFLWTTQNDPEYDKLQVNALPEVKKYDPKIDFDTSKENIARLEKMLDYLKKGKLFLYDIIGFSGKVTSTLPTSEARVEYILNCLKVPDEEVDVSNINCIVRTDDNKFSGDLQEFVIYAINHGHYIQRAEGKAVNCLTCLHNDPEGGEEWKISQPL